MQPLSCLHNQKVRIVDIELDGVEEILHAARLGHVAVDEVLVSAPNDDLPSHGDLVMLLVTHRTLRLVTVVEHKGDSGFGHTCLPLLVHKILQTARTHLRGEGIIIDCEERGLKSKEMLIW